MKTLKATDVGKRYNRDWIFRHVEATFEVGHSYAILGPNGSGKSTFLKALSGYLTLTEGTITYLDEQDQPIPADRWFTHLSYVGPYIDLLEEFTVRELIDFHFRFQPLQAGLSAPQLIDRLHFQPHQNKLVRDLSSGMRQRLKLITALAADTPILLLDEPATNLDAEGVAWYHELVEEYGRGRLIIVASNRADEYDWCEEQMHVTKWKK